MEQGKKQNQTPTLTAAKAAELKAGGFIPQRQKGKITIRCKAPGGRLTSARLERVAQVARKYGKDMIHLSVRQSPEIPYVDLADLDAVVRELGEAGQEIASCGKRFRVSTACGGCEYNPNGWTDSQRLALEATARFFGQDTPHKFKTCFAGCVRDCVKSRMTDCGFQGQVEPELKPAKCTKCTVCIKVCDDDALSLGEHGFPVRNLDKCTFCGDCIKACMFDAMVPRRVGHAVFVGGKHGKHPHAAYPLASLVPDELVHDVIEVTMRWYQEQGEPGERLGETMDRVGLDSFRRALREVVGEALLENEDLKKPKWQRLFYRGLVDAFPTYGELDKGE